MLGGTEVAETSRLGIDVGGYRGDWNYPIRNLCVGGTEVTGTSR
jgi:hypothetical protein